MKNIVMISLVLIIFILAGCGDGTTGNVVSDDAGDGDSGYASGPDPPPKQVKMTGTGHERACY